MLSSIYINGVNFKFYLIFPLYNMYYVVSILFIFIHIFLKYIYTKLLFIIDIINIYIITIYRNE